MRMQVLQICLLAGAGANGRVFYMASALMCALSLRSAAITCLSSAGACRQHRHYRIAPAAFRVLAATGASRPYQQKVNLDEAKAKVADLQRETSKANDGKIDPKDPASKARVCNTTSSVHDHDAVCTCKDMCCYGAACGLLCVL